MFSYRSSVARITYRKLHCNLTFYASCNKSLWSTQNTIFTVINDVCYGLL